MNIQLKKISVDDGFEIYEMLQQIPKDENGIINTINGITFGEYK